MKQKPVNIKILRIGDEMFISSESIALEAASFVECIENMAIAEEDPDRRIFYKAMKEGVLLLSNDLDERASEAYNNSELEILGLGDGKSKLLKLKVDG